MKEYSFKEVVTWRDARKIGENIYHDIFDNIPRGTELFVVIVDTVANEEVTEEVIHVFDSFMKVNSIMNNHEFSNNESVNVYCVDTDREDTVSMFYKSTDTANYARFTCSGRIPIEPSEIRRLFDNRATVKVYF